MFLLLHLVVSTSPPWHMRQSSLGQGVSPHGSSLVNRSWILLPAFSTTLTFLLFILPSTCSMFLICWARTPPAVRSTKITALGCLLSVSSGAWMVFLDFDLEVFVLMFVFTFFLYQLVFMVSFLILLQFSVSTPSLCLLVLASHFLVYPTSQQVMISLDCVLEYPDLSSLSVKLSSMLFLSS